MPRNMRMLTNKLLYTIRESVDDWRYIKLHKVWAVRKSDKSFIWSIYSFMDGMELEILVSGLFQHGNQ